MAQTACRAEIQEAQPLGDLASRTTTVIAPDGKVYFNLLPGVDVWGLTLAEARARLENTFTNFVREPPHIGVTLRGVESQRVWTSTGCSMRAISARTFSGIQIIPSVAPPPP